MVPETLTKTINTPIHEEMIEKQIRTKTKSEIEKEEQAAIDEENVIKEMEPLQKKRYLAEKKR